MDGSADTAEHGNAGGTTRRSAAAGTAARKGAQQTAETGENTVADHGKHLLSDSTAGRTGTDTGGARRAGTDLVVDRLADGADGRADSDENRAGSGKHSIRLLSSGAGGGQEYQNADGTQAHRRPRERPGKEPAQMPVALPTTLQAVPTAMRRAPVAVSIGITS